MKDNLISIIENMGERMNILSARLDSLEQFLRSTSNTVSQQLVLATTATEIMAAITAEQKELDQRVHKLECLARLKGEIDDEKARQMAQRNDDDSRAGDDDPMDCSSLEDHTFKRDPF